MPNSNYRAWSLISSLIFFPIYQGDGYVKESELVPHGDAFRFDFGDDDYTILATEGSYRFLGRSYTSIFANGNGIITMGEGKGAYTYSCNKNASLTPTIAAFMADTQQNNDPRNAKLLHKEYYSTSTPNNFKDVIRDVSTAFPAYQGNLVKMVVVTWKLLPPRNAVPFYRLRNTFQAVLATDNSNTFLLLYYNRIDWPSPETQKTPAQAGIFGGSRNLENTYMVPGSCNYSLVNIAGMSNFGQPGKFVFKVNSNIEHPLVSKCIPKVAAPQQILLQPWTVPVIGSVPLVASGFEVCLDSNVTLVYCTFHDVNRKETVNLNGSVIPGQLAVVCPTPSEFYSLGRVQINVVLKFSSGETVKLESHVFVVKERRDTSFSLRADDKVHWNTSTIQSPVLDQLYKRLFGSRGFPAANYVNISLLELRGARWLEVYTLSNVSNSGTQYIQLPENLNLMMTSERIETSPKCFKIGNQVVLENNQVITRESVKNIEITTLMFATQKPAAYHNKKCKESKFLDRPAPDDVVPCPVTFDHASHDWRFRSESDYDYNSLRLFRDSSPTPSGTGSSCLYDIQNDLVGNSGASHTSLNNRLAHWDEMWEFTIPQIHCCAAPSFITGIRDDNCEKIAYGYYQSRNTTRPYSFPTPFRVTGASNIANLNGGKFILNAVGPFWLLKTKQISMQILSETYSEAGGTSSPTIITTATLQSSNRRNFSRHFQVGISASGGLRLWMDGETVNFYQNEFTNEVVYLNENLTIYDDYATVYVNNTRSVFISYSHGLSIKFFPSANNVSLNIIGSLGEPLVSNVTGLLGNSSGSNSSIFNGTDWVNQWRVLENDSFLLFPAGNTYSNYINRNFQPSQTSYTEILSKSANLSMSFCNQDDDCKIDYLLTNNTAFATSSLSINSQYETMQRISKIVVHEQNCSDPVNVTNGSWNWDGDVNLSVGTTIRPNCNKGYHIIISRTNGTILSVNKKNPYVCSAYKTRTLQHEDNHTSWFSLQDFSPMSEHAIKCEANEEMNRKVKLLSTAEVSPSYVSITGHGWLHVQLPRKLDTETLVGVTCKFVGSCEGNMAEVDGKLVHWNPETNSNTEVWCARPILPGLGKITVYITMKYADKPSQNYEGTMWVHESKKADLQATVSPSVVKFSWDEFVMSNSELFVEKNCSLRLDVAVKEGKNFKVVGNLEDNLCNTGILKLSPGQIGARIPRQAYFAPSVFRLGRPDPNTGLMTNWITSQQLAVILLIHQEANLGASSFSPSDSERFCLQLMKQQELKTDSRNVLQCPSVLEQAQSDWRFVLDKKNQTKRPGDVTVFKQILSLPQSEASVECWYNTKGDLMIDSGSKVNRFNPYFKDNYWDHLAHDTIPYLHCCEFSLNVSNCALFYEDRSLLKVAKAYSPLQFAHVWGTGHVHTLSGHQLRLQEEGEYWLLKHTGMNGQFLCQIKAKSFGRGTVLTGLAVKMSTDNYDRNFYVVRQQTGSIKVFLDGEELWARAEFSTLSVEGISLKMDIRLPSRFTLTVSFQNGISFKISQESSGLLVTVSMEEKLLSLVGGLLGNKKVSRSTGSLDGLRFIDDEDYPSVLSSDETQPDHQPPASNDTYVAAKYLVTFNETLFSNLPIEENEWESASSTTFGLNHMQLTCNSSQFCMDDFDITNDTHFALNSKASYDEFADLVQVFNQSRQICKMPPSLVSGVLQVSNLKLFSSATVYCSAINLTYVCKESGSEFIWALETNHNVSLSSTVCIEKGISLTEKAREEPTKEFAQPPNKDTLPLTKLVPVLSAVSGFLSVCVVLLICVLVRMRKTMKKAADRVDVDLIDLQYEPIMRF